MRLTVGTIVGLMASGRSPAEILQAYPYLELPDIYEASPMLPDCQRKLKCPDKQCKEDSSMGTLVIDVLRPFEPELIAGALISIDESRSTRILPIP